ncbi:MAG: hypothetical protein GQ470_05870 [Gammaproteobacteria bacterium]|nr:hypothetical protein [Gammaproteobacteria bacterium]
MKKLLQGLSLVWIFLIPVVSHAHEGHGLMGTEHYHAPIDLTILVGLAVVGLLAIGLKHIIKGRK